MNHWKKQLVEIEEQLQAETKPLGDISLAVVRAATNCRDATKPFIKAPTEDKRIECEILIFYEFIYFFLHMTMRQAFAVLTESQIQALQACLGPLISSTAIDSYFAHWPQDLKGKITGEFYEKLNRAEVEYSTVTQSDTARQGEGLFAAKLRALFMTLGSNIASLAVNDEKDLTVIVPVTQAAITQWKDMRLNSLMANIANRGSDWLQRLAETLAKDS
ncbi:MAG: hypothetical protein DME88_00270 [Verrucomicrobia bacterium]|nr:MAG: hypothetical protein DME88_00270 [Verrucomicrobiota bacterium]